MSEGARRQCQEVSRTSARQRQPQRNRARQASTTRTSSQPIICMAAWIGMLAVRRLGTCTNWGTNWGLAASALAARAPVGTSTATPSTLLQRAYRTDSAPMTRMTQRYVNISKHKGVNNAPAKGSKAYTMHDKFSKAEAAQQQVLRHFGAPKKGRVRRR
eukprot:SAG11_NODE_797_length_7129_cov_1.751956_2_plen_159_part_00